MIPLHLVSTHIVAPALDAFGLYLPMQIRRPAALRLVLATGLAESGYAAVRQKGGGPALGWFQMERATHNDLWSRYVLPRPALLRGLRALSDRAGESDELETNPFYAAAMCRIFYLRVPEALPGADDIDGMARYWKNYYNTPSGKGTEDDFKARARAAFELSQNISS